MVNNIPVNGWPQLKDLEAVQPTLDRLDKIEAWKRTVKEETFTGDDITIENALALPARSLITEINAIQDLHGYDKPWGGGAYKNKCNIADTEIGTAWNGASNADRARLVIPCKANTQYTISINGTNSLDSVYVNDSATVPAAGSGDVFTTSKTFTTDASSAYIIVGFNKTNIAQADVDALLLQLELGGTATSFAPYSNICPIGGRDSVVLTRSDGDEISEDFTIQLGQTVYGGSVDFTTGVASVDMAAIDLGDLEWSAVNGSRFLAVNQMPGVKINTSVSEQRNAICSQYVWKKGGDLFNQDDPGFSYYIEGGENRLFVKDLRYATAQAFTAAMDGVTLVYELATPIELTLTPTEVQMLKGYNRVTLSDGYGTIELKALTGANWS